jgi:hypothetical protein
LKNAANESALETLAMEDRQRRAPAVVQYRAFEARCGQPPSAGMVRRPDRSDQTGGMQGAIMIALTKEEKEVVDQFQQLPPERQRYVMLQMFRTDADRWQSYQKEGEQQLRKLAAERNKDWDKLDDEQRQDLVNDLLHEDRP